MPSMFHPYDLPHAETLGLPAWLQWLAIVLLVAVGLWLLWDIGADRRRARLAPPAEPADAGSESRSARSASSLGEGVGAGVATDARSPLRARERLVVVRQRPPSPARRSAARAPWLLLALLVSALGLVAGWLALDRVRAVVAFAGFLGTDGGVWVTRLAFAFAALLWVGAALTPVLPRGAALAFAFAGGLGAFLATAARWERRLEWWGATAVLADWDRLPLWSVGAFALAAMAWATSYGRKPR